jgi:hypothetical protein
MKNYFFCTVFGLFLGIASLSAQTDISSKVKSLPSKNGNYLLHQSSAGQLFGVKKAGEISEFYLLDKSGKRVEVEVDTQTSTATNPVGKSNQTAMNTQTVETCVTRTVTVTPPGVTYTEKTCTTTTVSVKQ